jgi:hypothetical protein
MICRTLGILILTLPFLGVVSGCDNRPKIIMPTTTAPPAPRSHVAGPGGTPVEPVAPDADPNEKPADSKKAPADSTLPEDKN